MAIDISQLSIEVSTLVLDTGISGNIIEVLQGSQGEIGFQGSQGDPGAGIAVGGTPGQSLFKSGTFDYDTEWMNISITMGHVAGIYISAPTEGQVLSWDAGNEYFTNRDASGSSAASTSISVTQASHGLVTGDAVYFSGTTWTKALADSTSTLAIGLVQYLTVNTFNVIFSGQISGLSGLVAGEYYFVSDSVAGTLTNTEPSISNPILFALSTTTGVIMPWRPSDNADAEEDYINASSTFTPSSLVDHIFCDAAGGTFTVNLSSCSSIGGKAYHFKKVDVSAFGVIVDPSGAETIEGSATYTITGPNTSISIANNGTAWYILNVYRT